MHRACNISMNGILGHLNWTRRTSWWWWSGTAFRHKIWNSCPGALRSSTLRLGYGGSPHYWIFTSERGRNFYFFGTWMPERGTNPRSLTFQADSITAAPCLPGLQMKWNEWGFRPSLCTKGNLWAWRTFWGCMVRWHCLADTGSEIRAWRSEVEHATSRSRRLPTIFNLYGWEGRNILFLWNLKARVGFEPAISDFPSMQL